MSRIHPDSLLSQRAFGSRAVARVSAAFSKDRTRTSLAGLLLVVNIVLLAVFLFTSYKGFSTPIRPCATCSRRKCTAPAVSSRMGGTMSTKI